ncbi:Sec23/Sec24 domain-containing protein [Ordospora pajunii]|uniref:Sec23/Sec24 domain-containing protein n=1 Tax=Ordospora pajunii TaxID=3039483 RepID=UPI002952736C|nr:Sec23/Sec24 domain-containing protein [Ordospora pajunii]KAH9410606.1 Sec23/Sec24 domain-containing protein [Ordospora pajunii]
MEREIRNIEKSDGIRLTWNGWPVRGDMMGKVPLVCMYNIHQEAGVLECEPIYCMSCGSVLNPYCSIDFARQSWNCVICKGNTTFPSHARGISPENLLPELLGHNSTVEYVLSRESVFPGVFLFIVDTCTFDDERHALLIDALRTVMEGIPGDCFVGFIKYGTNVELLELSGERPRRVHLFSGKKEYTAEVVKLLNMPGKPESMHEGKFIRRKSECSEFLYEVIDGLERDPFPVLNAYKPVRCTGSAVSLGVSLMEGCFPNMGVKHMLFTQGPCTFGPGTVTSIRYKVKGRGDESVESDSVYASSSKKFYEGLGERMSNVGHSLDILAATIDDIGICHMERMTGITGGMLIMAQDFDREIYISSCRKIMSRDEEGWLEQGFNAKLQVKTSKNLEYKGVIGQGKMVGGNWRMGSMFRTSNISVLLDRKSDTKSEIKSGEFGYVQLITQYQRSDRKLLVRVTTFSRMFMEFREDVVCRFDQEAATVFQARFLLMNKHEEIKDCERMIDKSLIRFVKTFARYDKGDPNTLVLPDAMAYYPNFMFFFRRSLLVQTENNSADETTYYFSLLYNQKVNDALKLIKPTLVSYHYQRGVEAVEVDSKSLEPDVILVMDTFHNVVVWRGEYVAEWVNEGYHEEPEYESLKHALNRSEGMARGLCKYRLPSPQFCITEHNKSQQRIIHHYVNPSGGSSIITENINYEKFEEALRRVVVSNNE